MDRIDKETKTKYEYNKEGYILLIQNAPTADVVEVKHGYWIKTDRGVLTNLETRQPMRVYACDCSCCGWHTGNQGIDFKYCPHCGAKMNLSELPTDRERRGT